jgi:molybdenum cofactor biosynthesis protein B
MAGEAPETRLVESGAADHEAAARGVSGIGFAVITLSDTRTLETDRSGDAAVAAIAAGGHRTARRAIVKDDPTAIRAELEAALADPDVAVVATNGGTGISLRDSAYEVVSSVLEKRLDGFGELFRMLSYGEIGAAAMLSRATGGIARGKVVFALPGSTKAVRLGMEQLVVPQAAHVVQELRKHAAPGPTS